LLFGFFFKAPLALRQLPPTHRAPQGGHQYLRANELPIHEPVVCLSVSVDGGVLRTRDSHSRSRQLFTLPDYDAPKL
jgi:hypothetical protein